MHTIDASVWINGFDLREAGHDTSRKLLDLLSLRALPLVLPNLLLAEVAGAVSRTRTNAAQGEALATSIARLANVRLVPLDDVLAKDAAVLAAQHGLRGADAVYGAVARQAGATLITLGQRAIVSPAFGRSHNHPSGGLGLFLCTRRRSSACGMKS